MNKEEAADFLAKCGEITKLRAALRAVLPYAHTRAEDMHENMEQEREDGAATADESARNWELADRAVTGAYAILEGTAPPPSPIDALVRESVEAWAEQFDAPADGAGAYVSGADLVEWFAGWRQRVKAALA